MKKLLLSVLLLVSSAVAQANYYDDLEAEKRGDYPAAIREYKPLAEAGDIDSQLNLGFLYGTYIKDAVNSIFWYEKAAKQNSPKAYSSLGLIYMDGMGVPKDNTKAIGYLRQAARLGEVSGMASLSVLLLTTSSSPLQTQEGVQWMQRAAEAGNGPALYNLGLFYTQGSYVTKDIPRGIEYYKRAAQHDEVEAMKNLGFLYELGDAPQLKPDYVKAHQWFSRCAEFDSAECKNALATLKKKMTPAQLVEATRDPWAQ